MNSIGVPTHPEPTGIEAAPVLLQDIFLNLPPSARAAVLIDIFNFCSLTRFIFLPAPLRTNANEDETTRNDDYRLDTALFVAKD